jgi:hypothetical protein
MSAGRVFMGAGRLLLTSLAFMAGMVLGGVLAGAAGLPASSPPPGVDPASLARLMPVTGLLLVLALYPLARGLEGGFTMRWLILVFFGWLVFTVNTVLEARIFTTLDMGPDILVVQGVMFLAGAAALAALDSPSFERRHEPFASQVRAFFEGRSAAAWAGRLVLSWLAFPVIYFGFGMLVAPIVVPYYQQDTGLGLRLPGFDVLIPVLLTRSLLFLLACLPVLVAWRGDRPGLFWALGLALFMTVGGIGLLSGFWLPAVLRVTHGLEILADSFSHAAALVLLLTKAPRRATAAARGGHSCPDQAGAF